MQKISKVAYNSRYFYKALEQLENFTITNDIIIDKLEINNLKLSACKAEVLSGMKIIGKAKIDGKYYNVEVDGAEMIVKDECKNYPC